MSSTRDALMLLAGVATGAMGTFMVLNVAGSPGDRTQATSIAALSSHAPALAAAETAADPATGPAEHALGEERATRLRAEARVTALEEELAHARSAPAATPSSAATAPPGSTSGTEKKLDPAALAARLKEIEGLIEPSLAAKDGKKLLALYAELARYGKTAWPVAAKIGALFGKIDGGGEELGLSGMEFMKTFATADFSDLYVDALSHPDAYDKEFRKISIWGISMGDAAAAAPALIGALKNEKDPQQIAMVAMMLAQNSSITPEQQSGVADALVDAINGTKNKQTRQQLVWALSQMQGDSATRAIGTLAAAETDPAQRSLLELSLKVRASPVAGYYVSNVTAQSDGEGAGMKPGDVITSVNGKPVKNWQQLQTGTSGEDGAVDPPLVPIVLYRDGQTYTINVKGGKSIWELGIQGDFAKGTGR